MARVSKDEAARALMLRDGGFRRLLSMRVRERIARS
jgi:hypothetical protein